jgi:hypothetical protein
MDRFCRQIPLSLPDDTFFKSIGVPAKPESVFGLLRNAFQVK